MIYHLVSPNACMNRVSENLKNISGPEEEEVNEDQ
jgi:copper chaperone CopZ